MSRDFLVVIDMQKDFIDGSLGTAEAKEMLSELTAYVDAFEGEVVFTKDTHTEEYLSTQEGRNLPVKHCLKGTEGWELPAGLEEIAKKRGSRIFEKPTFPSKELAQYLYEKNSEQPIDSITIIGVCTDICVVSNAMTIKAYLPETPLAVAEKYTEATSREMKAKTLDVLRCCQVAIV